MKQVRLLPILIVAALALLLFKGIGLWTDGAYVLVGTSAVAAAGGEPSSDHTSGGAGGETTMTMPSEPTMTDSGPTLSDDAPTLGSDDAGGHGTEPVEHVAEETGAVAPAHGESGAEETACPEEGMPAEGDASAAHATTDTAAPDPNCVTADPRAEGTPMQVDAEGNAVPLVAEDGGSFTESAVLERLSARRAELDARDAELAMRMDLVTAAEARLEERTQALVALEARVNALVDAQKAAEEGDFAGLIAMYEVMKPTDAAVIFDDLDMNVLLRVARGINPRKMSPILAKMDPKRAQDLTVALAQDISQPAMPMAAQGTDLSSLPQIVGQ